jgi:hypothetical protein
MEIRPACLADLPEIAERLLRHYPGRATRESIMAGAPWMIWAMKSPDRLVLIGPNSFGIAETGIFYGFERRASVGLLCSQAAPGSAFEVLRMLRKMIAWARRKGALELKLDADNGTDFSAFAKRLGARQTAVTKYYVPLTRM